MNVGKRTYIHRETLDKQGFPGGSTVKNPPASAGDTGDADLIPGSGRSPGEGNGYQSQYSGLENPMDCLVHGAIESWTQLSDLDFQVCVIKYLY